MKKLKWKKKFQHWHELVITSYLMCTIALVWPYTEWPETGRGRNLCAEPRTSLNERVANEKDEERAQRACAWSTPRATCRYALASLMLPLLWCTGKRSLKELPWIDPKDINQYSLLKKKIFFFLIYWYKLLCTYRAIDLTRLYSFEIELFSRSVLHYGRRQIFFGW